MKSTFKMLCALVVAVALSLPAKVESCTNLIITKGASTDGSNMVTYNADAGGFMEPLRYKPAQDHAPGTMIDIYEWDSGKFLGKIKQVPHTFRVIGNMNEHQVVIGETTFTGIKELRDTNGIMDYGSLIYTTLERARTAREAIDIIVNLCYEYGYYSTGESFSIADKNEVWVMDLIGKGSKERGINYVARRVPDGYICAHANQSRIREFPKNDPENCVYNKDIEEFAIREGLYDPKKDGEFKFADAFNPIDANSLLACEGRVWSLFRRAAPSQNFSADYWRCVEGAEPYPLFVKPDKKLSVRDAMSLMRDHFEGTEFDMTKGMAAGPYGCPYRWKPLGWKLDGDTVTQYIWERPISTQQTAFAFVSQSRSSLPDEIGGVFWYGVDDSYTTVYNPLYSSMQYAPDIFTKYSISEFSLESAFWVFNLVSNLVYDKYSLAIGDLQALQTEIEDEYFENQAVVEKVALEMYQKDKKKAMEYLTKYSVFQSENTMRRWRKLWEQLVVKFNDGYVNDVNVDHGRHPKSSYYDQEFYKAVVKERPDYYKEAWVKPNKAKSKKKK